MEANFHSMSQLFAQLGLESGAEDIRRFIDSHRPLRGSVELHAAPFWSAAQAAFLREGLLDDADWSEAIDQLSAALRRAPA